MISISFLSYNKIILIIITFIIFCSLETNTTLYSLRKLQCQHVLTNSLVRLNSQIL